MADTAPKPHGVDRRNAPPTPCKLSRMAAALQPAARCPQCQGPSQVLETRSGFRLRRCAVCAHRFVTEEIPAHGAGTPRTLAKYATPRRTVLEITVAREPSSPTPRP